MILYEVMYVYDECDTPFGIGFFSSRENALAAIDQLSRKSGFCDSPEGFYSMRREITCTCCPEIIYEALIYFHTEDFNLDYGERLGLFLKREDAVAAVEAYHKDNPQLIPNVEAERAVNRWIIDQADFAEGFIKGEWYDTEI
jgi:hypothetical protein